LEKWLNAMVFVESGDGVCRVRVLYYLINDGIADIFAVSTRWRQGMKDSRFLSADIDPAIDANVARQKQEALRLVRDSLTADRKLREDAAMALSLDYADMGPEAFSLQLRMYSLILDAFENKRDYRQMAGLLGDLLRTGIYRVDGRALDAITIRRDAVELSIDGRSTLIGNMKGELLGILSLGKESRETERRLALIDQLVQQPRDENIEAVARAIKLPVHDTRKITGLIRKLFDERGNFIRQSFDPMLDELARHGNMSFELLWGYFKALKGRANRVAFLNSLQHLISRIERPKHALRLLLSDFCRQPGKVAPTDRNAVMLSNILLRTYNKELDVDIELTPEEVLNVRNGLAREIVHYAQFRLDAMDYRFTTKIRTIHEMMTTRLTAPSLDRQMPSVRHLLYLEREIYIFLALLSGRTAHLVLFSALKEYGDPQAGIYRHPRAATYLPVFLQQLKIIARGATRVSTTDDVDQLRQICAYGPQLSELNPTPENQRSVRRILEWIERGVRSIGDAGGRSA
jgi:hypothetical protein